MSIDMSTSTSSVRLEVYDRLKKAFNHLSSMLDAHLTDEILHTLAVDHVQVDLENETERGGPYFLPMSQECMDSLNKRPEFAITFDEEWSSSVWGYDDADTVHMAYRNQLYDSNDESVWHAWQGSHWQPRFHKSRYQMRLLESRSLGYTLNPRLQFDWRIEDHFAAEGFPHRSCVSRAAVPDVTGLTRSEMMIVTGMMIAAMREKGNQRALVVPLVLVSIIGRFARLIQAHVALEEQRLKVRYSQLYDFENCSQRQMDLFLRWTLSSPLLEPIPEPDAETPPGSSTGDTAPIVTVSSTQNEESRMDNPSLMMEA